MKMELNGTFKNIVASAAILTAIVAPIYQNMSYLQNELNEQRQKNKLLDEIDLISLKDRSEMKIQFMEVETQFRSVKEIIIMRTADLERRIHEIESSRIPPSSTLAAS